MRPTIWTKDKVLVEIKALITKHGGQVSTEIVPQYLYRKATKFFGSWESASVAATGNLGLYHRWSKQELIDIVKSAYDKLGRFPTWEDMNAVNSRINSRIPAYFSSFHELIEQALGSSQRIETLRAIIGLSKDCSDGASVFEIRDKLKGSGYTFSIGVLNTSLRSLVKNNYIESRRLDRMSLWRPTVSGILFFKTFTTKA
jgi:hypothetical protein